MKKDKVSIIEILLKLIGEKVDSGIWGDHVFREVSLTPELTLFFSDSQNGYLVIQLFGETAVYKLNIESVKHFSNYKDAKPGENKVYGVVINDSIIVYHYNLWGEPEKQFDACICTYPAETKRFNKLIEDHPYLEEKI